MSPGASKNLANFLVFQVAWFGCVLGAAHDRVWWGVVAALIPFVLHVRLLAFSGEWRLWVGLTLAGFLVDSALASAGILHFREPLRFGSLTVLPIWMIVLWLNYATLCAHSMSWLAAYPRTAVLLGAIGSGFSYRAGVALGALDLHPETHLAYLVLGIEWGIVTPLALREGRRLADRAQLAAR